MPRNILVALVSLGCLSVLAIPSRAPAQEAAELASLCVDAYGGPEAIAAASAFVQVGEIVSTGRSSGAGRILPNSPSSSRSRSPTEAVRPSLRPPGRAVDLSVFRLGEPGVELAVHVEAVEPLGAVHRDDALAVGRG